MKYLIHIELSPDIEDFGIFECDNSDDAMMTGWDIAISKVDTNDNLREEIQTEAKQALEYEGVTPNDPSDWLDKVYCDIIKERAAIDYWHLKDDVDYGEVIKNIHDYKEIVEKYKA